MTSDHPTPAVDDSDESGALVHDFFPHSRLPVWLMLAGIPPAQTAVVGFLMAHIDEQSGRMTAWPTVDTISSVLPLKTRATQYALNGLIDMGALEVVPMYIDNKTGQRTPEPTTGGRSNKQTSNSYTVCMTPPGGMTYPGPINLAEFYDNRRKEQPHSGRHKGLLQKRIDEAQRREFRVRSTRRARPKAGGVHTDAPSPEQAKSKKSQEKAGCNPVHPPGASECTPPVHPSAPESEQGESDQNQPATPVPAESAESMAGGMETPTNDKPSPSPGAVLLRDLDLGDAPPLASWCVTQHAGIVDDALASGMLPATIRARLADNLGAARNPAGVVVSRLGDLRDEVHRRVQQRQARATPTATPVSRPPRRSTPTNLSVLAGSNALVPSRLRGDTTA